ncbi:3-oxoacyl-[acyl-carrier-protein] synthase-3 [Actinomadura meyerae]|jgi:3-oxoacyl-[acyl-carrier-protein] synthase-3|uniref:3-oxoacyl-[acyl-carrier-protein] synthase-3 n=1 Tax=Actinomadura meyerae TaxID=240840 RepID=A0A239P255_9ACTN|nr:3-oxoacyl-ACP synthase III family protein [Actinomadura meyerae]SNT60813.1 3-oxoacyl-[acyl-carrier-protein] synthase-3 [Actinomadura meyerae]
MEASEVRLLAAGTALPGPPVGNGDLARRFGMDELWEEWVETFVGTRTRHLSVDLASGEIRTTLADLAERAARRALDSAGVAAADLDVIVMGTATPDTLMPATVNVVADRLGVDGIPTYQLQSGCTGAVQALEVARLLLAGGGHRHALVIAGDSCAKHFDVGADLRAMPPAELVNVVVFGDGAGAAVLSADPVPGAVALRTVLTRFVGLGREPGQVVEWFGRAERDVVRAAVAEDYKAIEERVPVMAAETLRALLDELGWKDSEVDYLLPPQLSGRMSERIAARIAAGSELLAEEIGCVAETGNCGNALAFFQLERLLPELDRGERAIGIAIESSKWIKAGFALERG